MMEMRVMMVMNLNGGKLHRFLYSWHIEKKIASRSGEPRLIHRRTSIVFEI